MGNLPITRPAMIQNIIRCSAVSTECLNNWETLETLVDKLK